MAAPPRATHQRRVSITTNAADPHELVKAEMLALYPSMLDARGKRKLLPLSTSVGSYGCGALTAFAAFGAGLSSFFKTLKCLTIVFFLISVLSLPALVLNVWGSGVDYSMSGISLDATTLGHLASNGNFTSVIVPFSSGKMVSKSTAVLIYAVLDVIGVAILLLAFCYMKYWQIVEDVELQSNNVTLDAYSVYVRGLPPDVGQNEIKNHFQQVAGGAKVAAVQVIKDNMHLYDVFVKRGRLFRQLQRLEESIQDMEAYIDSGEAEPDGCCGGPRSQLAKLRKRRDALVAQTNDLTEEARDLTSDDVVAAFVTFDRQDTRATVLEEYSDSWARYVCQPRRLRLQRPTEMSRLVVRPAPAPSTVLWENLNVSGCNRYARQTVTTIIALLLVIGSFALVFFTSVQQARLAAADQALQCATPAIAMGLAAKSINATSVRSLPSSDPRLFCYCDTVGFGSMPLSTLQIHPLVEKCAAQTCPRFFKLDYTTVTSLHFCVSWLQQQTITTVLVFAASVGIIIVNVALAIIMRMLTAFESHHSIDAMEASLTVRLFFAQFFNTAVLMVLINTPINQYVAAQYYTAKYSDMVVEWYTNVGTNLMTTVLIQIITPHLYPIMVALYQWYRRGNYDKVRSLGDLEDLYRPWHNQYSLRYAQITAAIFVCYTFSTGMPLMNLVAFASLLVAFLLDKLFFLRLWARPPTFSSLNTRTMHNLLPLAMLLHLAVGAWALSQESVLTDSFDPLAVRSAATRAVGTQGGSLLTYSFGRVLSGSSMILFIGFLVLAVVTFSQILVSTVGFLVRTVLNVITCGQLARYINSDGVTPVALQVPMPTLTQAKDVAYISRHPEQALTGEQTYSMLLNKEVQAAFSIVPEFAEMATSLGHVARYSMQVQTVNGREQLIATWSATQRHLLAAKSSRRGASPSQASPAQNRQMAAAAAGGARPVMLGETGNRAVGAAWASNGAGQQTLVTPRTAAATQGLSEEQMIQNAQRMRAALKRGASMMLIAGGADPAMVAATATTSDATSSGSSEVLPVDPRGVALEVSSAATGGRASPAQGHQPRLSTIVGSGPQVLVLQLGGAASGSPARLPPGISVIAADVCTAQQVTAEQSDAAPQQKSATQERSEMKLEEV